MLFKILKLFGLDVPAKIEAVKASLELRLNQTTHHVKEVAQEAAVIGALSAIAAITSAMTVAVGLIALYRWTADAHGVYAGLGVVGTVLVVVTVIFATAAMIKGKSLAANRIKWPRYAVGTMGVTSDPNAIMSASAVDSGATGPLYDTYSRAPAAAAPTASASDLVEPLAFFLSKVVKYPSIGNPVFDELIGNLRTTAHGTTDEAISRAADVVRRGSRTNLLVVLTGAVFVGWLLTHHSGSNR
jgi:hypothetical protein